MHSPLVNILILGTVWFLVGQPAKGQQIESMAVPEQQPEVSCSSVSAHDDLPAGPEISIANVRFSGSSQLQLSDLNEIADSIKQKVRGTSFDTVMDEAQERATSGWQDHGYFKAKVAIDSRTLTATPTSQTLALNVHVSDEDMQYRLAGITFKNNRAISNAKALRNLFPIKDGEVFSRQKIAEGLEKLRKAYGEYGYVNFTSVPDTQFDDENKLISLEIDIDEGKQFYVSEVEVLGLDEPARKRLLKVLAIKRGQVYNSRLWEMSLSYSSKLPHCSCPDFEQMREDLRLGVVKLILDFRPCSAR